MNAEIIMDTNTYLVLKLYVVGIMANTLMTTGLSATENIDTRPKIRTSRCNETTLLMEMERCGDQFKKHMLKVDQMKWCNLTHFIRDYNIFSYCTEQSSESMGCYWPNPLVESYIIHIHKLFFSNCTLDHIIWVDPPDNLLIILIFVPVFLTLSMIALVVWCSRRSDTLA
ncbi:receptor activity-modifying protein 3 [Paramormyrops kingsleyae]|uniref:receptor activity-modifying protein 3 n=1 Tax=Paramormyrops kingsleyae TaxID=1676925 RepID=UPI003B96B17E